MVDVMQGYYIQDDGEDVFYYFMNAEPPDGQYKFKGGVWKPMIDGYFLMDKIIDGNPEVSDPTPDPPAGVPPFESPSRSGER